MSLPTTPAPDEIEVNTPEIVKGKVEFMSSASFGNPAPDKLKRILTAIRYTLVGMITMVSGTDLFSGYQSKVISFSMGVLILICGGIELATGVKPVPEDK